MLSIPPLQYYQYDALLWPANMYRMFCPGTASYSYRKVKRSDQNLDPCSCPYCVEEHFGVYYTSPFLNEDAASPPSPVGKKSGKKTSRLQSTASPTSASRTSISTSNLEKYIVTSDAIRPGFIARQQEMAISRAAQESQRSRLAQSLAAGGGGFSSDLSGAATAAASIVETFQGRYVYLYWPSSCFRTSFRNSMMRSRRDLSGERQLSHMRNLGADLEEIMLMEAMRRSLMDDAENVAADTSSPADGE